MVTLTSMDELGYPVEFPEGKTKAVILLIHETPDKEIEQFKGKDDELLLKDHHALLNRLKDSKKKKYKFATPPWTPDMEVVGIMGEGQANKNDNGASGEV